MIMTVIYFLLLRKALYADELEFDSFFCGHIIMNWTCATQTHQPWT